MAKNTVRVNVTGDASSFKKAMGQVDESSRLVEKGMRRLKQLAYTALVLGALKSVKDFVGDSKRAFIDLNESLNAVEVTYGKSADGVKQIGKEAATSLGLSNAEFNAFAVSISAFAQQIAGDSGDVVGVVDDLTTRVSDFASVMNLEVNDAARLFQSGLAGESEPLRKYGIDVSAATIKHYALANGIIATGEELTEAQKVQARYGTIMEQTGKVAGDFANTSGELANQTRIANAQMENSKAIIGQALKGAYEQALPIQVALAQAAARAAISFMEFTGAITALEAETLRLNEATGGGAEDIREMADALKTATEASRDHKDGRSKDIEVQKDFEDILKSVNDQLIAQPDYLDLTEKSAQELSHEAAALGREYGWTRDQVKEFTDMLLFQQRVQSDTSSGDMWLEGLRQGAEELPEVTDKTDELSEAQKNLQSNMDKVRKIAAEVQEDYIGALTEMHGVSEKSWTEMAQDVDGYLDGFKEVPKEAGISLDKWRTNFQNQVTLQKEFWRNIVELQRLGLHDLANEYLKEGPAAARAAKESVADPIQAAIDNAMVGGAETGLLALTNQVNSYKPPGINFELSVPELEFITGKTGVTTKQTGTNTFKPAAKGAKAKKGEPFWVGEEGPEPFIPDQNGTIVPHGAAMGGGSAIGGASINVTVYGTVLTPTDLIDAIHEGLLQKQKRNGGLGLAG